MPSSEGGANIKVCDFDRETKTSPSFTCVMCLSFFFLPPFFLSLSSPFLHPHAFVSSTKLVKYLKSEREWVKDVNECHSWWRESEKERKKIYSMYNVYLCVKLSSELDSSLINVACHQTDWNLSDFLPPLPLLSFSYWSHCIRESLVTGAKHACQLTRFALSSHSNEISFAGQVQKKHFHYQMNISFFSPIESITITHSWSRGVAVKRYHLTPSTLACVICKWKVPLFFLSLSRHTRHWLLKKKGENEKKASEK